MAILYIFLQFEFAKVKVSWHAVKIVFGVESGFENEFVQILVGGGGIFECGIYGPDKVEEDGGVVFEGVLLGEFVGFEEEELVEAVLKKL